ncbi:MAG: DUF4861 domain-containing protein [Gracilimonas sp.]|nr:DUF4861 domain-containing protein [Gracilimonas sp.]
MRLFSLTIIGILLFGIAFLGCSSGEANFTITNNSEIDREDEPVILTREMVIEKTGEIPLIEEKMPLPKANGKSLPSQLDDLDGDGTWDEIAFTLPIQANSSKEVSIVFVDRAEFPEFDIRTNVRFGVLDDGVVSAVEELSISGDELPVPLFTRFQMDGPAWENDKVGFRQYIDGRNGRDLYGKKMSEMALDTVGIAADGTLEDNYHVMLPWGRDILAVGNSLGIGGIGIIENGEAVRLGVRMDAEENNVQNTRYTLITEGPVRSIFKLQYEGWVTPEGNMYDLENTVTIWAGKYGYTNDVSLTSMATTDTVAIGLVNIHNDEPPVTLNEVTEDHTVFYTHDKQTYDDGWYLGMGLIFPDENYIGNTTTADEGPGITNTFLNLIELEQEKSFSYHVFAGWELSDPNFADAAFFDSFMKKETQKISNPVRIQ